MSHPTRASVGVHQRAIRDHACAQQCQNGSSESKLHLPVPHRTTLHLSPNLAMTEAGLELAGRCAGREFKSIPAKRWLELGALSSVQYTTIVTIDRRFICSGNTSASALSTHTEGVQGDPRAIASVTAAFADVLV